MLANLWAWFVGLFSKEKIGILFVMLFKAGSSGIGRLLADVDLHQKALKFVRELALRDDLTNKEKAALFNERLLAYGKQIGTDLCESVINCLRELAVNALKSQSGL